MIEMPQAPFLLPSFCGESSRRERKPPNWWCAREHIGIFRVPQKRKKRDRSALAASLFRLNQWVYPAWRPCRYPIPEYMAYTPHKAPPEEALAPVTAISTRTHRTAAIRGKCRPGRFDDILKSNTEPPRSSRSTMLRTRTPAISACTGYSIARGFTQDRLLPGTPLQELSCVLPLRSRWPSATASSSAYGSLRQVNRHTFQTTWHLLVPLYLPLG